MAMAIVMQKDIIAVAFQRGAFKAEDRRYCRYCLLPEFSLAYETF
ncbi:MAG: hypothetical protein ACLT0Y_05200 [Christensenellales bacterium]